MAGRGARSFARVRRRGQPPRLNSRDGFGLIHVIGIAAGMQATRQLVDQGMRDRYLARDRLPDPHRSGAGIDARRLALHSARREHFLFEQDARLPLPEVFDSRALPRVGKGFALRAGRSA